MSEALPSIIGISFDGLSISGIVYVVSNAAGVLRSDRFRVLFDVGYDISMGRTAELDCTYFPPWVEPIRCIGSTHPRGYSEELVEEARACVIGGTSIAAAKVYDEICRQLAALLVTTFERENLRFLIIENG